MDSRPRPGERYRCHICRLSLDFDAMLDRLVVAPLESDHQSDSLRGERARMLPSPLAKPKPRHK